MASQVTLREPKRDPPVLWHEVKRDVFSSMFGNQLAGKDADHLSTYFQYYSDEVLGLSAPPGVYNQELYQLPAETHEDLLKVLRILQANFDDHKSEIRLQVKPLLQPAAADDDLNRCIDITVRLWLMLNLREHRFDQHGTMQGLPCLAWRDDESLREFVHSCFAQSEEELSATASRLPVQFVVAYMSDVCGLKVEFTTSLADHLSLDREKKVLSVFYDEMFLRAHRCISMLDK